MKKLFALLMVAVMTMAMSVAVFADETVIREGSQGNGSFDLSAYEEGTLRITFTTSADTIADGFTVGWGVGALCENVDGWPAVSGYAVNLAEEPVDGGVYSVDFDLAAAKAAGCAVINLWGGCSLVSVSVITAASAGDATPVVAIAMVAMVACAAFVVLNKKEA